MGFSDKLSAAWAGGHSRLSDTVTYAPGVGPTADVNGIFSAAYEHVAAGHAGVSSFAPMVFLQLADLPSDPETDTSAAITVNAVQYDVEEVKKDGMGGVMLILHRSA